MFGDHGVAAIRSYKVFRTDFELAPAQPIATSGGHTFRILNMAQILGAHARLCTATTGGSKEDRFHEGLRQIIHHRRAGKQVFGLGQRMVAPALHPPDFFAGKAFAEDVLAHQILMGRVHIGLVFDLFAQIAQNLHCALVGDMRAWRIGQPAVAVDGHVLDAIGRQ